MASPRAMQWPMQDCGYLAKLSRDYMRRQYRFEKNFLTELNTKEKWYYKVIYNLRPGTIKWFTEGSKTDKGTGAGEFRPGTKYAEAIGRFPFIFHAILNVIDRCVLLNQEGTAC